MARSWECGIKLWLAQPGHGSRDPVFVSWHVTLDEKPSALPDMQKESESPSFIMFRDAQIIIVFLWPIPDFLQANGPIPDANLFFCKQMYFILFYLFCSITSQTITTKKYL